MKTIGIIGGSTDLATVAYYNLINASMRAKLGGLHTAEIIINSMDLALSAHYVTNGLWTEGTTYLHSKAKSLERAGADFVICVSNTWHRVSEEFMAGVGVPFLHIADPTADAIKERGLRRLALLGTKATMGSDYMSTYFARLGIEVAVPGEKEQGVIDAVIFEELSFGKFTEESRGVYLRIIDKMVAEGVQGVILGCTEIGLLISQDDRPGVPFFDTMRLHAEAAAVEALKGE